ncbi:RES domain-containing protein [Catalinimonas alkaloidigena]|uniref:RES domain-containing protein n=1 Tax=Catalinimonas alkaloidigena TaxID=1075417 RepID=A0A1G9SYM2_9BACT|nr:RES family NAD+ phosphorylase [Catalinimonas alkaloidigena]SDM40524.1 RES domain-containing protein [Catalinimonas alkaloidigena]
MRLYRLCNPRYTSLDGQGAYLYGGRWNPPGVRVVYLSESISLAALEIVVHLDLDEQELPPAYQLLILDVPDDSIETVDRSALPADWQAPDRDVPAIQAMGQAWAERGETLLLEVPSVIIPREVNYVLNPMHPRFKDVTVVEEEPFRLEERLWNPNVRK